MLKELKELMHKCDDEYERMLIQNSVDSFVGYVNSVIDYAVKIPIAQESHAYDRDRLITEIQQLDHTRHYAHEAAISGCTSLNRLCELKGVEHIAKINTENREEVAQFVGNFVNEMYNETIRGGMDRAVEEAKEQHYPRYEIER